MDLAALAADVQARAELCPHPKARARQTVYFDKPGRPMGLCPDCRVGFEAIIAAWSRRELAPREVVAKVSEMGYSRRDAVAFLLGLEAARLRVRLGFAKAS